jgi:SAM-dependent methyltransferase
VSEEQEEYIGDELELFQHATRWKRYFGERLRPFIQGDVLEVGAGIGGTTGNLFHEGVRRWVCLEPDPVQCQTIDRKILEGELSGACEVMCGTQESLSMNDQFDTILYIDVLEHIERDREELEGIRRCLRPGGKLIVLSPAFNSLFTPFDKAIGHFRRYNKRSLQDAAPSDLDCVGLFYLDSLGLMASVTNKFWLQQSMPTLSNVLFWDRILVPLSKPLDWALGYRLGKSIIGIWQAPETHRKD